MTGRKAPGVVFPRRSRRKTAPRILVLKLGGELLERPRDVDRVARMIASLARRSPLVVVHGGGKEIDAALASAGIPKQQVDGLRVTDPRTLDVVVAVLAGAINTRLVAAVRRAGAKPVGLTGADAAVVTVKRAAPIVGRIAKVAAPVARKAKKAAPARALGIFQQPLARAGGVEPQGCLCRVANADVGVV